MKLRARLGLAFVAVVLPSSLTAFYAVARFEGWVDEELERRRDEVTRAVDEAVRRELASLPATLERAARQLERSPTDGRWAPERAAALGLDLLSVLEEGRIASSAHLPMSEGDRAPSWAGVGASRGFGLSYVDGNPPTRQPALLAVLPLERDRILFGGRRLDERFLGPIARVAQAEIQLLREGEVLARFGPELDGPRSSLPLPPMTPGDAAAELTVALDATRLLSAAARTAQLVRVGAFGGLAIALLLAAVLAARLTHPLAVLAAALERVGRGDPEVRVPASRRDELGQLARGFNRMTEDLARAQTQLLRAEREAAWREMAKRLAHEIKNPLSPMRLGMENLRKAWQKQHPLLGEILEESTTSVLDEVRALDRLVGTFSSLARLPTPEPRPTAPQSLLEGVARLYELPPPEIDEALPPVLADPDAVHAALVNLVKNGREAGGSVQLSARPGSLEGQTGVWLDVLDDGPGMEPEVARRAPEAAFTTKSTGSGLGLAIVSRTMEAHGGRFELESTLGRGTRASLWLPYAPTPTLEP